MNRSGRFSFPLLGAAWLLALWQGNALAAQCMNTPPSDRPTIGLALGGGGARGFAHIGVLKFLEENRIPYDYIAGTSMGSLVGGMAAVGMDSADMSKVVREADWDDLFADATARQDQPARRKQDDIVGLFGPKLGVGEDSSLLPTGLVSGQKILFLFESVTSQRAQANDFDELPVPFRAIATDIVSGDMVVMGDGSLAGAMRASMAVPGAFDPVRVDDKVLVDGGLVRNLPVDIVRNMGADIVIAVNVGTPLTKGEDIRNVIDIVAQMSSLQIVANSEQQIAAMKDQDILISPALGDEITSASFGKFEDAWPLGYEAAEAEGRDLSSLSLSEEDYLAWQQSIARCASGSPEIEFVRLNNQSRFSDEVLNHLITVRPGDSLDTDQLDHDLRQIYGLGFIQLARYRVVEENGQQGIVIDVLQDERGTDFIETGLTLSGSGRGTKINLQAGYLKSNLDGRGSEARVAVQVGDEFGLRADIFKYLDDKQRWIVSPALLGSRRNILVYDGNSHPDAELKIDEVGVRLTAGREFGRSAAAVLGISRSVGQYKISIGEQQPDEEFDAALLTANLVWDRLDNLFLPTRGTRAGLEYLASRTGIGADAEYDQYLFSFVHSHSFDAHNVMMFGRYNTTVDSDAPIYAQFTGGGFLNMSGFEPNELIGQHFGFVGAGYRYKVIQSGFFPGYVGGTIEYGNAAETRSDIFDDGIFNGSVYFGYDTPLGPLYVGYGFNGDRSGVFFLNLGSVFAGQNVGASR